MPERGDGTVRARSRAEQIRSHTTRHDDCGAFAFLPGEPTRIHHMILEGHIKRAPSSSKRADVILACAGSRRTERCAADARAAAHPGGAMARRLSAVTVSAGGFERVPCDHRQLAIHVRTAAAEAMPQTLARVREASTLPVEAGHLCLAMPDTSHRQPAPRGVIALDLLLTRRELAGLHGTLRFAASQKLKR